MIIAGTGHRPNKLYQAYSVEGMELLIELATQQFHILEPSMVISGVALGWDTALAIAAIRLQIPVVAAVPFVGQEKIWPPKSQQIYNKILSKSKEVVIVSEGGYSPAKMQVRNIWMADRCDTLLALWNGTQGGTGNCVEYAKKKDIRIVNCWPDYETLLNSRQIKFP